MEFTDGQRSQEEQHCSMGVEQSTDNRAGKTKSLG